MLILFLRLQGMHRDVAAWRNERVSIRAEIRKALQLPPQWLQHAGTSNGEIDIRINDAACVMVTAGETSEGVSRDSDASLVHRRAAARMAEGVETLIDIAEHQQNLRASLVRVAAACEHDYCRIIEAAETWHDMHAVGLVPSLSRAVLT